MATGGVFPDPPSQYAGEARLNMIVAQVKELRNYIMLAKHQVPEDAGGRREHLALKFWAGEMANYWTGTLRREFTIYFLKQATASPAAEFLVAAMNPLDPEAALQISSIAENLRTLRRQLPETYPEK